MLAFSLVVSATASPLIKDCCTVMSAIIHRCYSSQTNMIPLSELLKQCSDRNRSGSDLQVLSVSNKYGFIAQSNQFEDREVASDDTSNYKVVKKGMFAYNPARINVGSIALYEMDGNGIVSPMYVCFTTKSELLPSYLKYYFASQTFKHEMYKRLEGSVRLCLPLHSVSLYTLMHKEVRGLTFVRQILRKQESRCPLWKTKSGYISY